MRGSKAEPGVIPLAVNDLFRIIQQVTTPYFHFFLGQNQYTRVEKRHKTIEIEF